MEALLYFALWAVFIFVMMRAGCGAHVAGHGRSSKQQNSLAENTTNPELRWVPPDTDIDPVCKKTVTTQTAKSSVHAGSVYYFCSRDCREVFEAAPHLYAGSDQITSTELEPSHV